MITIIIKNLDVDFEEIKEQIKILEANKAVSIDFDKGIIEIDITNSNMNDVMEIFESLGSIYLPPLTERRDN